MRKKYMLSLLCATLIISGCTTNSVPPDVTPEQIMTTAPNETEKAEATSETTTSETTATTETTEPVLSFYNLEYDDLYPNVAVMDNFQRYMMDFSFNEDEYIVVSENSLEFPNRSNEITVRYSSNLLSTNNWTDISATVKSQEFKSCADIDSAYEIIWNNPVVNYSHIERKKALIESADLSYTITKDFHVNGFIKKDGENYKIIIDPAYMYNLPMFSERNDWLTFDINGREVIADALSAECTVNSAPDFEIGENYVYASLYFSRFDCNYNNVYGYSNKGYLNEVKYITDDTDSVIDDVFDIDGNVIMDKDAEMTDLYDAIMNNYDEVLGEDVYGLELVDLDFDDKPEVLVSRLNKSLYEDNRNINRWGVDVDIYRTDGKNLKYIDTIYNMHIVVYETGNRLGLMEYNGEKMWFGTSYKNRDNGELNESDYLYRLNGDKLEYIEIFTSNESAFGITEDSEIEYRYLGEVMVPEITYDYEPYYDPNYEYPEGVEAPEPDWPYYHWGKYNASFGMWEIAGWVRQDFTDAIEVSYNLYSDWMLINNDSIFNDNFARAEISERSVSYKIANMIDEYFLGTYDNTTGEYSYDFLGAYAKPVIYLYPEEETEVSVAVEFTEGGEFTCTYPEYGDGWQITAMPDGTLYDKDGNEYYCLYWEGDGKASFDMSKGFCVKGSDTAEFLREKLLYIGLTPREANEFIIYWLPLMEDNKYNIINFHTDDYAKSVPMTISPASDTQIRVFMTFCGCDEYIEISQQTLPHYERNGFTVVEWGGGECTAVY